MQVMRQCGVNHRLVEGGWHHHGADLGGILLAGALEVGIAPLGRQPEMGLRVVVHVRVDVHRRHHLQAAAGHVRGKELGAPRDAAAAGAHLNQAIGVWHVGEDARGRRYSCQFGAYGELLPIPRRCNDQVTSGTIRTGAP